MTKRFNQVTDHNEYSKLVHDLEPIKSEFIRLLDDYKYLNERFNDAENPMTDGEIDWWGITKYKLEGIYKFINTEFAKSFGVYNTSKMHFKVQMESQISELYEQIHDRRQLGIENDPILAELYNDVRKVKLILGRG